MKMDNYFKGKSIKELIDLYCFQGIAVFLLENEDDEKGLRIWEDIFLKDFIKEYPQYENSIVKKSNDFYGEIVLRIRSIG